ncbi:MAG: hypothetical protein H6810_03355 [Phycisphaeraceae bacterium]|nr:MAG: hypothetical protein H6810_03355 [Phycisphaeraceae bacterium]
MIRLALVTACLAITSASTAQPAAVTVRIDTARDRWAISPLIYGSNHDLAGYRVDDARRLGGNRLSTYNWEIDASNAGKDASHVNDDWLTDAVRGGWWSATGSPPDHEDPTAWCVRAFLEESAARQAYSLITIPIAGFVAGDLNGRVAASEAAPAPRWRRVVIDGPDPVPEHPDTTDRVVSSGEMVRWLVRWRDAHPGVHLDAVSLDNEPDLWAETHPYAREAAEPDAFVTRSIQAAIAVKRADPAIAVFGPALFGASGFRDLSRSVDWSTRPESDRYDWFIDYYLDRMRRASERAGVRLLDDLDVHWYADAMLLERGGGDAALNASRSLHDPTYHEPSWVTDCCAAFLPLLPRLRASIDKFCPGTAIAISEYDWLLHDRVESGIAQADALGAFGANRVHFAAYHHRDGPTMTGDTWIAAAFRLFRETDEAVGRFGDTHVFAETPSTPDHAVYASVGADGTIHAICINRRRDSAATVSFTDGAGERLVIAAAKGFDAASPDIHAFRPDGPGATSLTLAPLSVGHVRLQPADAPDKSE